ncbi:MAG: rhamnulose-1-phosphate aldolase [Candidatus Heimdallarchaeota archaeon]
MRIVDLKGDTLELVKKISEISWLMYEKDWAEGSGGNFSILLSDDARKNGEFPSDEVHKAHRMNMSFPALNGRYFLVKGSRKRMRDIRNNPEDNLCIGYVKDNLFQIVWPYNTTNIPTSEISIHLAIQQNNLKSEINCPVVLHAHPTELTGATFSSHFKNSNDLTKTLSYVSLNIPIFLSEGIGYLEYCLPGSKEMSLKTTELMKQYRLVLWEFHGVVCTGKTLSDCFDLIEIAEKAAKIWRIQYMKPSAKKLTKKQIEELKENYQNQSSLE